MWVAAALAAVIAGSSGCARVLYNFGTVEDGRIYRSAQPSPLFLEWLTRRPKIRTLVNLRGRTQGFESRFAADRGLRLFSFDLSASRPPSQEDVDRFLGILDDPANYPILVHCRNGVDRTGYMLALYRVQRDQWTPEEAAWEMRRFLQFKTLNRVPQMVVTDGIRQVPEGESPR